MAEKLEVYDGLIVKLEGRAWAKVWNVIGSQVHYTIRNGERGRFGFTELTCPLGQFVRSVTAYRDDKGRLIWVPGGIQKTLAA